MTDLDSLAAKLSALDLTDGEGNALAALLASAGQGADDVGGFALQRMQQTITGVQLANTLVGSGFFTMGGSGTQLHPTHAP